MALNRELVLNYAEALYAEASAREVQHQVREEVERVLAFASFDPDALRRLSYAFNSAGVSRRDKEAIIQTIRDSLKLGDLTRDWLALAARHGRFNLLPHFIRAFIEQYRTAEGLLLAEAQTAFPLSKKQLSGVKAALEKALNASVDIEVAEKPALIAGLRVRVAGRIWDMSVKGALERAALRHA